MAKKKADFSIQDEGSILILNLLSKAAQDWAEEYLPEDRMSWGKNGVVVEHRYIGPIVDGMIAEGLTHA